MKAGFDRRRPGATRPGAGRGFVLLGLVAVLGLMGLLAAWGQAAHPLARLRDLNREAMALQARTAADAGLAFALAQLNAPQGTGARCEALPVDEAAAWAEPLLRGSATASASGAARGGASAANAMAQARCAGSAGPNGEARWACDCGAGEPTGGNRPDGGPDAAFNVALQVLPAPSGSAELEAAGCVRRDGDCARPPEGAEPAAVRRRLQVVRWPALARDPLAVATAGGGIRLGPGVTVRNDQPSSGGRVLLAGRGIAPNGARVEGLPGAPLADLHGRWDPQDAARPFDAFVADLLGLPLSRWRQSPRVRWLDCTDAAAACAGTLQAWVRLGVEAVAVRGALALGPGVRLGRIERPVVLVVDGPFTLRGPGVLHGAVIAESIHADGRFGDIDWQGVAVARGDLALDGRVVLRRSPDVLSGLAQVDAAVLPLVGSWRDAGIEGEDR